MQGARTDTASTFPPKVRLGGLAAGFASESKTD